MKRIFLLLGLIAFFAVGINAQTETVAKNGSNFDFNLDAGDTLSDNSTTLAKYINLQGKPAVQLYSIQVTVDKITGTPTQAWTLDGSMDKVNWTNISTVNWAGTADTTFYYTDISTGVAWGYLRVLGTESGTAKGQLTELIGRALDKVR